MRDQFLDELGGVQVLPESSTGAGRLEVTIDERVAGRPLDEHGERAAAARSTAWPWVVGAAVIALAAVFWVGFSDRGGGQTSSAEMPPPRVTVSKPLARDVDTRIGLLGQFSAIDRVELRAQVGGTLTETIPAPTRSSLPKRPRNSRPRLRASRSPASNSVAPRRSCAPVSEPP